MGKTKVLEKLYYGNINESERLLGKIAKTEEYKQYQEISEKFIATLNQEQEALFEEFFFAFGGYHSLSLQRTYANGVKLGMALGLELVDFDPSFQSEE